MNPNGIYVTIGGGFPQIIQTLLLGRVLSLLGKKKSCFFIAQIHAKDLEFLGELLASGKIRPVIDREYAIGETAEALGYLEQRHARGKVVVTVRGGSHAEKKAFRGG